MDWGMDTTMYIYHTVYRIESMSAKKGR
jgi:hypothetical protein